MADRKLIEALVANPSESLTVEVKRWIDPTDTQGIAKIAKGAIALRNRNGGFLVVGFDDTTMAPDVANEPPNAKDLFHIDIIQAIISKYASQPFEVIVDWVDRDGGEYPVLVIPSGVKVPVAAKRDLMDDAKALVREGAVYFRSLASNGTASTTEAKHTDWSEIVEICFDNREADFGRFFRRHLSSVDHGSLISFLTSAASPAPTLCDKAYVVIEAGEDRFNDTIKQRRLSADEAALIQRAFWSIGMVIAPSRPGAIPDQEFLERLASSNPRYTGWPIWLDARHMSKPENRPKVVKGAFEYLIVSVSSEISDHVDFARLDPKGEFFLHRLLQDDGVPRNVMPGQFLDPTLMALRVAEAMAVGISFAKALGYVPDQTNVGFAFRWYNLKGRSLTAWANERYLLRDGGVAHDDSIETCVQFSLDTPLSALPQFVDEATKRLFAAFDGAVTPRITIDDLVKRLVERTLGW